MVTKFAFDRALHFAYRSRHGGSFQFGSGGIMLEQPEITALIAASAGTVFFSHFGKHFKQHLAVLILILFEVVKKHVSKLFGA